MVLSGTKKTSAAASMSNQTSHFGIMGGLAPSTNIAQGVKRFRLRRARNRQTIPLEAAPGLAFMREHGILSVNPTGSGGVGLTKVLVDRSIGPCNCGPEPAGDSGDDSGDDSGGALASGRNSCQPNRGWWPTGRPGGGSVPRGPTGSFFYGLTCPSYPNGDYGLSRVPLPGVVCSKIIIGESADDAARRVFPELAKAIEATGPKTRFNGQVQLGGIDVNLAGDPPVLSNLNLGEGDVQVILKWLPTFECLDENKLGGTSFNWSIPVGLQSCAAAQARYQKGQHLTDCQAHRCLFGRWNCFDRISPTCGDRFCCNELRSRDGNLGCDVELKDIVRNGLIADMVVRGSVEEMQFYQDCIDKWEENGCSELTSWIEASCRLEGGVGRCSGWGQYRLPSGTQCLYDRQCESAKCVLNPVSGTKECATIPSLDDSAYHP